MATTAPRPGQAGYIADPRTAKQIAAMGGPSGGTSPSGSAINDWYTSPTGGQMYGGDDAGIILNLIRQGEYGQQPGDLNKVEDITQRMRVGNENEFANAGGNNDAQQAFMAQRGIQGGLDEATMKATERLLGNAGMHFGQGGGDWAKAWTKQMSPLQSNFMKMYGGIDTDLFNSASGPYGQMQQAAAYTAPARNDRQAREYEADTSRYIADRKYDTASQLFSQLQQAINKPNIAGVETDYGAFAKVMPTLMAKYMPKR